MLGVAAKTLSGSEASQLLKQFLALDKVRGFARVGVTGACLHS